MHTGACRAWKRVSELLELELQVIVSLLVWVLDTKLWFSEEAGQALLITELSL